jgi:chorismate mutase
MNKTLADWRNEIDEIDNQILQLLAKRIAVVKEVGKFKKNNNIPFFDPERKKKIIETKIKQAEKLGLPELFIRKIYEVIHDLGLAKEEELKKP